MLCITPQRYNYDETPNRGVASGVRRERRERRVAPAHTTQLLTAQATGLPLPLMLVLAHPPPVPSASQAMQPQDVLLNRDPKSSLKRARDSDMDTETADLDT